MINYVIATTNTKFLEHHLDLLNYYFQTLSLVTQVTVMCPLGMKINKRKLQKNRNYKIIFEDSEHPDIYAQWLECFVLHSEHEYYIFIRDDYVPTKIDFEYKLIQEYRDKFPDNIGYLCALQKNYLITKTIAIPNGIISNKSLQKFDYTIVQQMYNVPQFTPVNLKFSALLYLNGIDIKDWADKYGSVFWNTITQEIEYYNLPVKEENLIVPIQYLES